MVTNDERLSCIFFNEIPGRKRQRTLRTGQRFNSAWLTRSMVTMSTYLLYFVTEFQGGSDTGLYGQDGNLLTNDLPGLWWRWARICRVRPSSPWSVSRTSRSSGPAAQSKNYTVRVLLRAYSYRRLTHKNSDFGRWICQEQLAALPWWIEDSQYLVPIFSPVFLYAIVYLLCTVDSQSPFQV